MNTRRKWSWPRWDVLTFAALALYPLVCGLAGTLFPDQLGSKFGFNFGDQLSTLFIYGIFALALNVAVGYAGLLQLGIAAFFAIGAYITGILTVNSYPFQVGFTAALGASIIGVAATGLILGAPSLRLRGDYLAIVTLGFGEIVKSVLINLEEITAGTRGLNPIPPPHLPPWFMDQLGKINVGPSWTLDYRLFYYLALVLLFLTVAMLHNLELSRLGRSWVALREDELAASCMGINTTRIKLSAFAVSAGLAGMAGCLYATKLQSTADPNAYGFNLSITMLCCVILGGLGSIRGTLLGVFVLMGFDKIVSPAIDTAIQDWLQDVQAAGTNVPQWADRLLSFSNWRLMIFGLALILVMRFRPEGLLPSLRMQQELHHE
jgi:branched-chain amino acid transport system permease protein